MTKIVGSNKLEEELNEVAGAVSRPRPFPSIDWNRVYYYLRLHKDELPEDLRKEFESFHDYNDPKFETFVCSNLGKNDVIDQAYLYGGSY